MRIVKCNFFCFVVEEEMKPSASVFVALCLFLQLAGGKDLYWQPNSNWGNPSNWALGRVPNCKDDASLTSVGKNFLSEC